MRRLLALVLALLPLGLSTTLALATPAHAGGPTSVLITDPGSGDASALYYSDPAYGQLDTMLLGAVPLDQEPSDLGARGVHLTWMAHDVHPWRTQQLYTEAAGGPVLATYDIDSGATTWARVGEGKAVALLVDQVLRPGAEPDLAAVDAAADAAPPAAAPAVEERVVAETAWWSLAGWRWAVLGLLVGAGAVPLVVRRPDRSGARRELIDLDPSAEPLTR
jgi:hypothetical protein